MGSRVRHNERQRTGGAVQLPRSPIQFRLESTVIYTVRIHIQEQEADVSKRNLLGITEFVVADSCPRVIPEHGSH